MRKIADIDPPRGDICRCMIYGPTDYGFYLFLYDSGEDGPCTHDLLFETLEDADAAAETDYGVRRQDWQLIDEPLSGAQHDWIRPTRVKRGEDGEKLWGEFEPITPA